MPRPSPFFSQLEPLSTSKFWKDWAGYFCARSFDTTHDREYYAFRNAVGAIDVTPLYKYEVKGSGAADFLSWVTVKNCNKLKLHQATYLCWCDEDGKVVDDGTVIRLSENHFMVTAAEPSLSWFDRYTRGFDVSLRDITQEIGALAVQGPFAREVLQNVIASSDTSIETLRFFHATRAQIKSPKGDTIRALVTRTGYTGDLGFEIWVKNADAPALWDAIWEAGRSRGIEPCGMDAMDVTRIEAGFIMNGVDYFSAHHQLSPRKKSSPFEIGLGWTVQLNRGDFNGSRALQEEKEMGSAWQTVGLEIDWVDVETQYNQKGLPPSSCTSAWREFIPLHSPSGEQVGYATSGAWSPRLKKSLALARVSTPFSKVGQELQMDMMIEFDRKKVRVRVVPTPFFNPDRKRSIIKTGDAKKSETPRPLSTRGPESHLEARSQ